MNSAGLNIRIETAGVAITSSIADGSIAVEQTASEIPTAAAPKAVAGPTSRTSGRVAPRFAAQATEQGEFLVF